LAQAGPIGVFDSGVGGLSVLRALQAEMPQARFVYVADSGHAPYGERDDAHVLQRSQRITNYLVRQHGIAALVVACNTATAAAIARLRTHYPLLPVVGIEPALKPAAARSQTGRVGVMATRATLASEKFRSLLERLQGQASFVLQPCDGLADAIERHDLARTQALCQQYLLAMGAFGSAAGQMDTLVLGCTHYAFASAQLQALLGPAVGLLEGGGPVARQTRRLLEPADTAQPENAGPEITQSTGDVQYFSTGDPGQLAAAVKRWLQAEVTATALDLP